jgi:ATP-binding cassette subfamily F protein 3
VLEDTATDHLARLMPDAPKDRVRARLGGVGLVQEKQTTKVKHLSGGEKARLTIALITHDSPHVLILDEPTNHLDIDARDALVQALNDYKGAVILISHDRRLLELTVDRLWMVADGTVQPFDGDLSDYAGWLRDRAKASSAKKVKPGDCEGGETKARGNRKEMRKAAADRRKENADIRNAAREAEKALEKLTARRQTVIDKLGDPLTYEMSTKEVQALIEKKEVVDREIAAAETAWLQASEALEAAE